MSDRRSKPDLPQGSSNGDEVQLESVISILPERYQLTSYLNIAMHEIEHEIHNLKFGERTLFATVQMQASDTRTLEV